MWSQSILPLGTNDNVKRLQIDLLQDMLPQMQLHRHDLVQTWHLVVQNVLTSLHYCYLDSHQVQIPKDIPETHGR